MNTTRYLLQTGGILGTKKFTKVLEEHFDRIAAGTSEVEVVNNEQEDMIDKKKSSKKKQQGKGRVQPSTQIFEHVFSKVRGGFHLKQDVHEVYKIQLHYG